MPRKRQDPATASKGAQRRQRFEDRRKDYLKKLETTVSEQKSTIEKQKFEIIYLNQCLAGYKRSTELNWQQFTPPSLPSEAPLIRGEDDESSCPSSMKNHSYQLQNMIGSQGTMASPPEMKMENQISSILAGHLSMDASNGFEQQYNMAPPGRYPPTSSNQLPNMTGTLETMASTSGMMLGNSTFQPNDFNMVSSYGNNGTFDQQNDLPHSVNCSSNQSSHLPSMIRSVETMASPTEITTENRNSAIYATDFNRTYPQRCNMAAPGYNYPSTYYDAGNSYGFMNSNSLNPQMSVSPSSCGQFPPILSYPNFTNAQNNAAFSASNNLAPSYTPANLEPYSCPSYRVLAPEQNQFSCSTFSKST